MGGHRILVADADTASANTLVQLLAVQGHDVRSIADERQALPASIAFQPELVIFDLAAPDCRGLDAARTLHRHARSSRRRILLLGLITHADASLHDDAHAAGFDLVIPKGVDGAYLCDLVRGLIDSGVADARPDDPLERALLVSTPLH